MFGINAYICTRSSQHDHIEFFARQPYGFEYALIERQQRFDLILFQQAMRLIDGVRINRPVDGSQAQRRADRRNEKIDEVTAHGQN